MKKVAIILATYNGERYLSEQLESLRKQTYKKYLRSIFMMMALVIKHLIS